MFSRKGNIQQEIGSLIGATTTVTGDVDFSGGLRIDGVVKGAVRCVDGEKSGMLVISEHGSIIGEVKAAHLVVAGRVEGPVHAAELVELQPKARIKGDVHYRALEMHHGAIVEGMMVHIPSSQVVSAGIRPDLKAAAGNPKSDSATGDTRPGADLVGGRVESAAG
jgi:cytoskeletal protein CcmA (bactofilin family)